MARLVCWLGVVGIGMFSGVVRQGLACLLDRQGAGRYVYWGDEVRFGKASLLGWFGVDRCGVVSFLGWLGKVWHVCWFGSGRSVCFLNRRGKVRYGSLVSCCGLNGIGSVRLGLARPVCWIGAA